jgi:hypothetical protein
MLLTKSLSSRVDVDSASSAAKTMLLIGLRTANGFNDGHKNSKARGRVFKINNFKKKVIHQSITHAYLSILHCFTSHPIPFVHHEFTHFREKVRQQLEAMI